MKRLSLRRCASVAGLFVLLLGVEWASGQVDVIAPNRITYNLGGETLKLPYYRNHALSENTDLRRAVIMIHGTSRNAEGYYQTLLDAAAVADSADTNTILIAPQFLIEVDISDNDPADSSILLFWTNARWKRGSDSDSTAAYPHDDRISSYSVMDSIIIRLATNNSSLEDIVIAGHSAGGQYVNRYAAGSNVQDTLEALGISLRHVVANPSSYVYFDSARRDPGTEDVFDIPTITELTNCASSYGGSPYNDYKYGLDNLNIAPYMNNVGMSTIRDQYKQRWVMYLLGENDNDPASSKLDTSCAAFLQGIHRLQRGTIYYNYLNYYYGGATSCRQVFDTIPGAGHNSSDMFTSDCGAFSLFDYGSCENVPLACTWVQFNYVGTEVGSFDEPFNTVAEGVNSAPTSGTVMIKAGTTSETLTIDKRVYLRSWTGAATIGEL